MSDTLSQLNLARADLARHGHLPKTAWAIRQRIARLKAELRQEHADFMRFLDVQAKEQAERREQARKRRETWRFMTPMSCDDYVERGWIRTQNCEVNPDL